MNKFKKENHLKSVGKLYAPGPGTKFRLTFTLSLFSEQNDFGC